MNKILILGLLLVLLVGIGIGIGISSIFSHKSSTTTTTTTPSSTTATTALVNQSNYTIQLYTIDGFPVCVFYFPNNVPKNVPQTNSWTLYDNSQNRDAYIPGSLNTSWVYEQMMPAFSFDNISGWENISKEYGAKYIGGYVQTIGDSVPPSYANGIVYAAANNYMLFGINAETGKTIFIAIVPDVIMTNPLVYKGMVYVTLGGALFDYSQGGLNAYGGGHRGKDTGLNGIMALNATDGKPMWFFITRSQAMPTPVILNDTIYFDDGDGYLYALNATSGKLLWKVGPFGSANMASLDYLDTPNGYIVVAGFSQTYPTNVSEIVGVYTNGTIAWITKLPFAYDSGPGDAVMTTYNDYVIDGFISGYPIKNGSLFDYQDIKVRSIILVMNGSSGNIIWIKNVSGYVYPREGNNGIISTVVNGIIYTDVGKAGKVMAINLTNGNIIWETKLYGSGSGNPTYVNGYLLIPASYYIEVVNASTGKFINLYPIGQNIGKNSPIVVGDTVIVDGDFGYVEAIPLYYIIHNTTSIFQIYKSDFNQAIP